MNEPTNELKVSESERSEVASESKNELKVSESEQREVVSEVVSGLIEQIRSNLPKRIFQVEFEGRLVHAICFSLANSFLQSVVDVCETAKLVPEIGGGVIIVATDSDRTHTIGPLAKAQYNRRTEAAERAGTDGNRLVPQRPRRGSDEAELLLGLVLDGLASNSVYAPFFRLTLLTAFVL